MPVWSPKFSSVASHGAGRLLLDASLCMNLYVLYQKCRRWVLQMLLLLLLLIVAYCMLLVACCVLRVACCCCCCSCSCCCFCCCCWCCCCCCCFPSVWLKQLSHRLSNLFHSSHFWKMMSQPRMWMSHVKSQSISTNFQRSGTRVLVDPRVCFRVS